MGGPRGHRAPGLRLHPGRGQRLREEEVANAAALEASFEPSADDDPGDCDSRCPFTDPGLLEAGDHDHDPGTDCRSVTTTPQAPAGSAHTPGSWYPGKNSAHPTAMWPDGQRRGIPDTLANRRLMASAPSFFTAMQRLDALADSVRHMEPETVEAYAESTERIGNQMLSIIADAMALATDQDWKPIYDDETED